MAGLLLVASLAGAVPAMAQTGGAAPPGGTTTTTPTTTPTAPGSTAQLQPDGTALPPADAPRQVRKAIKAGNRIHTRPYIWGGGHRRFKSKGYDCSGAVSYLLHAAGLLRSPLPSGPLMTWGAPGTGSWITVYANRSSRLDDGGGPAVRHLRGRRVPQPGLGSAVAGEHADGTGYSARFFPGF